MPIRAAILKSFGWYRNFKSTGDSIRNEECLKRVRHHKDKAYRLAVWVGRESRCVHSQRLFYFYNQI
jgi:hypothetical protein